MQKFIHLKQIILLLGLMLPAVWCGAKSVQYGLEGPSNVPIKVMVKLGILVAGGDSNNY